jgi:membrane protease YdiL (CAAX protease family)
MFSAAIVATVLGYTWIVAPIAPRWTATAAAAVVLALAVTHAIQTREWGLHPSAFAPALARAAAFTLAAGAGVALAGWRLHTWHARPDVWRDALILVPWGFGQQFALQTTLLYDAKRLAPRAAVLAAAAAFAALHLPNPFLTAVTFAAAVVWCRIYARHPSVLPLALSHAALTLVVLCAFDDAMTGRLRVGAAYLASR